MDRTSIRDIAAVVAASAGVLLLADLSLGWYDVSVNVDAADVHIKTTASGWGHLGVVAGLLTIAMLLYMIRPLRRDGSVSFTQAVVTGILGLAAFSFTVAAALTNTASVTTPAAAVQIKSTLWPAYVGIGLGTIVAGAAITALVLVLRGVRSPSHLIHPTA